MDEKIAPLCLAGALLLGAGWFMGGNTAAAASSTGNIEVLLNAKKFNFRMRNRIRMRRGASYSDPLRVRSFGSRGRLAKGERPNDRVGE